MQLWITNIQLHSFVTVQILWPNLWWTYNGTNNMQFVLQCLPLFFIYVNCQLMSTIITFTWFHIWYAHPVHEGAEFKVYLLESFETAAFSLSMYPLIPKFQVTASIKDFEINWLTDPLRLCLVEYWNIIFFLNWKY